VGAEGPGLGAAPGAEVSDGVTSLGIWGLFDVAQGTVYASPPRIAHIRDEFDRHFRVEMYARQVGLAAPGYSAVISFAMQTALGYRPTLRTGCGYDHYPRPGVGWRPCELWGGT
jgi:hypothetical protein